MPLAVVEAKDPQHRIGDGMQQALEYADMLGVPFAFSSNGAGFLFSDRTGHARKVETELKLADFPPLRGSCRQARCGDGPRNVDLMGRLSVPRTSSWRTDTWRIVHRRLDDLIQIHAVLDGRRNLEDILMERMLKS